MAGSVTHAATRLPMKNRKYFNMPHLHTPLTGKFDMENLSFYKRNENSFGKVNGKKQYYHAATTDNAVQINFLNAYVPNIHALRPCSG
jgi:hypothetical protein